MGGPEAWLRDTSRAAIAAILYLAMILLAAASSFYAGFFGFILTSAAVLVGPFAAARVACWVVPSDRRLVLRLGWGALAGLALFLGIGYALSRFPPRISESSEAALTIGIWILSFFVAALVLTRWKQPLESRPLGRPKRQALERLQTRPQWRVLAVFAVLNALGDLALMITTFQKVEGNRNAFMLGTALLCVAIPVWSASGVLLWLGKSSGVRRFQQICALSFGYCAILFASQLAHGGSFIEAAATGQLKVAPYAAMREYENSIGLAGFLAAVYLAVLFYSFWALRLPREYAGTART